MGGGLYLRTIYKRDLRDKIRINIQDKEYWIKEFESNGFRFEPQKLNQITKDRVKIIFSFSCSKETIKFKIGKKLYQKGGYIGENIVLLVYKLLSLKSSLKSNIGALYFTKGD